MLGDKLKALRNQLNRTQENVATDLEMSRASYSHLENNRNQPDNETLKKLADYYSVSVDYLLDVNSASHSTINPITGQRISYLRKRAKLSQPALANRLNVSQSTITSWENNRRNITTDDLIKVADLFSVTTDYLLGHEPNDGLLTAAHQDDDLTPEQKEEIRDYIEFKKAQYRKQHEKG